MKTILGPTLASYAEQLVVRRDQFTTKIWPGRGRKPVRMKAPAEWFAEGQSCVPFLLRGGDDGQAAPFKATHVGLCVGVVHDEHYHGLVRALLDALRIERFCPSVIQDFAGWERDRDIGVGTYYVVTGTKKLAAPIPFDTIELVEPGTIGRFVAPRFTEGSKNYARVLLPMNEELTEWLRSEREKHEALLALPIEDRWKVLASKEAA